MPLVHDELHRIAQRCMAGERAGHTLQATALVNEAYLRLIDVNRVRWQDRAHFLSMAARLMRRVLVDAARAKRSQKRAGDIVHIKFDELQMNGTDVAAGFIALNDALDALAAVDERKSRVIELRFFGGLSVKETAEALQISVDTVMRDWKLAKAWLLRQLRTNAR